MDLVLLRFVILFTLLKLSWPAYMPSSSIAKSPALRHEIDSFKNVSQNLTSDNSDPWMLPVILPYLFPVPDTQTILYLGFGLRRFPLPPEHMRSLLAVSYDYIAEQVERQGAQTLYPVFPNVGQQLYKSLGDGIHLVIKNVFDDQLFTWGTLHDVVKGLQLYLIDGRRFRQCYFNFHDFEGVIGSGQLGMDEASKGVGR